LRLRPNGISLGEPLAEFHGVLTGVPSFTGVNTSQPADGE
jgi:hypothetical protein